MVGAQATAANLATPRLVEGIQDRGHKLSILTTALPNSEAQHLLCTASTLLQCCSCREVADPLRTQCTGPSVHQWEQTHISWRGRALAPHITQMILH